MKSIVITDKCTIYNDMPRGWSFGKGQPAWHGSIYHRWYDMWTRCNNPNNTKYKNYKDCEIDEKYRYLSNYVNDIMQLENFDKLCENPSKYDIDKDKIDPNNRCYFFEHLTILSDKENSEEQMNRNGVPTSKKRIKGINIKDGSVLIFDSIHQATELGFNSGHLVSCCKGRRKSHKGYRWEYIEEVHNE